MRILNLGVLVCVGGILAALPFRHSRNASLERLYPARATGPTIAVGDPFSMPHPQAVDLAMERVDGRQAEHPVPLEDLIAFEPPAMPPVVEPRHALDLPTSYEELAVPVMPSSLMQDRFSATLDSRPPTQAPSMLSPSPTFASDWDDNREPDNREPLLSESIGDADAAETTTNFVSAPLPKADRRSDSHPNQERYWIRQP